MLWQGFPNGACSYFVLCGLQTKGCEDVNAVQNIWHGRSADNGPTMPEGPKLQNLSLFGKPTEFALHYSLGIFSSQLWQRLCLAAPVKGGVYSLQLLSQMSRC